MNATCMFGLQLRDNMRDFKKITIKSNSDYDTIKVVTLNL